jgi:GNAT superfamily N-acetyltransferase
MEFKEVKSENSIHIYCIVTEKNKKLVKGVSECSLYDTSTPFNSIEPVYYFNRIFVNSECRNKGIATELLKRMLYYVKEYNHPICCDINPYGDLTYVQLRNWYRLFGFKEFEVEFYGIKYKQLWFNLKESV